MTDPVVRVHAPASDDGVNSPLPAGKPEIGQLGPFVLAQDGVGDSSRGPAQSGLAPPSTESFLSPSQDEADRVLLVYRSLDRLPGGVKGDGFTDGLELTRERRGPSWAHRWEDVVGGGPVTSGDQTREDEILAKTDRYGFFAPTAQQKSGHQRSAPLPARAYDSLPFASSSRARPAMLPSDPTRPAVNLTPRSRRKEQGRVDKWADMLEVADRDAGGNALRWRFNSSAVRSEGGPVKTAPKTQRRVYKGIPDRWRPAAWLAAVHANAHTPGCLADHDSSASPRESTSFPPSPTRSPSSKRSRFSFRRRKGSSRPPPPGLASLSNGNHLHSPAELLIQQRQTESWREVAHRFAGADEIQSEQDVQIDLDVPRTISGHLFFHTRYGQGQRALFRVLHAFSLVCPDCGYCQGMGSIACVLLCYFEPASAYAMLVRMHDGTRYNLHRIFAPGFPGLSVLFALQSKLMAFSMPSIAKILDDHKIPPSMYATKWYITLFYNVVPFETQLRIWDAFLLDGSDVLVLAALALIWGCRSRLLAPQIDFEAVVEILTCFFYPEDDDAMMMWIRRMGRKKDITRRLTR